MCRLYRQLDTIAPGAAITIGNFDGVHKGHKLLIQRIVAAKQAGASATCVILFEPQPRDFFAPSHQPTRLMSFAQKYRMLGELGVDNIFCLRFNTSLANQSYPLFWQSILQAIQPSYVVLGQDFRFGFKRQGSIDYIEAQAITHGYKVEVIPNHADKIGRISSTRLRQLLHQQDFASYQFLTGRGPTWQGKGQHLVIDGVDTFKLSFPARQLPLNGVYLVKILCAQSDEAMAIATVVTENGRRSIVLCRLDQHRLASTTAVTITWLKYIQAVKPGFICAAPQYSDLIKAAQRACAHLL